ncbi:MAG: phosphonate ABC transporter, permease protein PhnE, partial [Halanaerobiales bacterium]
MPTHINLDDPRIPRRDPGIKRKWTYSIIIILAAFYWSARTTGFNIINVVEGVPDFFDLIQDMYPPKWSSLPKLVAPFIETVQIAVLGTFAGAILAIPLSLLSANNVNKIPALYYICKAIMNLIRTIPHLLYAALLVAAVGLGPFPGVIALTFFSLSIIAKLTSESLEAIDPGPMEALEAAGATKLETIIYAVIPQIAPAYTSYSLYVFEINIRTSTVLGLVGAGGIGQTLMTAL